MNNVDMTIKGLVGMIEDQVEMVETCKESLQKFEVRRIEALLEMSEDVADGMANLGYQVPELRKAIRNAKRRLY